MKTFGIIAGILGVIALLGWIVGQTLSDHKEDSAYNMHPSNFEKPDLEKKIDWQEKDQDDKTLDLTDKL